MERALQVLNELEQRGVLGRYAIGGAMGVTFYAEPILTYDLNVFAVLPEQGGLLSLTSFYEVLKARGYTAEAECVLIEGVPVQFLPAYNALLEEALREAREIPYGKTHTRVLSAEHLVAIAVQTGRTKDRERVRVLRDEAHLDAKRLSDILRRHGLYDKWLQWTA